MKTLCLIICIACIIFGLYEIIIDNEKGVAYVSFLFGAASFLFSFFADFDGQQYRQDTTEVIETTEITEFDINNESEVTSASTETEIIETTENFDEEYGENYGETTENYMQEITGDSFSGNISMEEEEDYYLYDY